MRRARRPRSPQSNHEKAVVLVLVLALIQVLDLVLVQVQILQLPFFPHPFRGHRTDQSAVSAEVYSSIQEHQDGPHENLTRNLEQYSVSSFFSRSSCC